MSDHNPYPHCRCRSSSGGGLSYVDIGLPHLQWHDS